MARGERGDWRVQVSEPGTLVLPQDGSGTWRGLRKSHAIGQLLQYELYIEEEIHGDKIIELKLCAARQ